MQQPPSKRRRLRSDSKPTNIPSLQLRLIKPPTNIPSIRISKAKTRQERDELAKIEHYNMRTRNPKRSNEALLYEQQHHQLTQEKSWLEGKVKSLETKLKHLNNKAMEIAEHRNILEDDNEAFEVRMGKVIMENVALRGQIEGMEQDLKVQEWEIARLKGEVVEGLKGRVGKGVSGEGAAKEDIIEGEIGEEGSYNAVVMLSVGKKGPEC